MANRERVVRLKASRDSGHLEHQDVRRHNWMRGNLARPWVPSAEDVRDSRGSAMVAEGNNPKDRGNPQHDGPPCLGIGTLLNAR